MNLSKLFETQAALDERIYESHPVLKGQDNLDWKVLALQVELGECANEWRGFKKWSNDQEPRTCVSIGDCRNCGGTGHAFGIPEEAEIGCWECDGSGEITKNPLLEEYVDCLHFILSIGLEHKFDETLPLEIESITCANITYQFTMLMRTDWEIYEEGSGGYFHEGLELFLGLGEMLGFEWEQIEQAYYAKNQINHQRQEENY